MTGKLKADRAEVIRYLGGTSAGVDDATSAVIDEVISESEDLAEPRYRLLDFSFSPCDGGLRVGESPLVLTGNSIAAMLEGCSSLKLLAATVGHGIDRRIRQYEAFDMQRAVIMDACGSTLIEALCDDVCGELDNSLASEGKFATERFSPGYGDLPLDIQPAFLELTGAQRSIGLSCSDSFIMAPRKSVTAVIGVRSEPRRPRSSKCAECPMHGSCRFGICSANN